jgi:FkbM family methyltransferase
MYNLFRLLEKISAFLQGKGYGTGTVRNEVKMVRKLAKEVRIAFDIGGNKGTYTQQLRKFFPDAQIVVFEPSKENIKLLKDRFENDSHVKVEPFALSNFSGKSTLYSDLPGSGIASLSQRNLDHFNKKMELVEEISVITFAEYYEQNFNQQVIDFVKLDVEGHELSVLEGMKDHIKNVRCIQFEFGGCNLDTKTTFQDFWYYFTNLNFQIFRITPFGLMHLKQYSEADEFYRTTNFICLNTQIK